MRVNSARRVLRSSLAILFSTGVLTSLAQPRWLGRPAFAQQASVTLRGLVTAASDGSVLPGATVTIEPIGVVLSNERGEYSVALPPGTYTVSIEATGYAAQSRSVTVAGGGPAVQDFSLAESTSEVITIVGSRTPRSQLETSVPVDIITSDVLAESSHTETNQILATLAPSFNATHLTVVDGTDHIDPATLRGLGPEHVLVLVNGRRLHQTSLVNVYNGGTVGVDLNAIPTSAIERIEVLRDGAASQYGSDAIAGVINIVLKDTTDVVNLYSLTGITASNDGVQFKLGGNTGVRLGERGFVNVTAELFSRGRTNRSKPWPDDIFPGITGVVLAYSPWLYLPLALLHAAVAMRVVGDVLELAPLRLASGTVTVAALLGFTATLALAARRSRSNAAA